MPGIQQSLGRNLPSDKMIKPSSRNRIMAERVLSLFYAPSEHFFKAPGSQFVNGYARENFPK